MLEVATGCVRTAIDDRWNRVGRDGCSPHQLMRPSTYGAVCTGDKLSCRIEYAPSFAVFAMSSNRSATSR